MKRHREHSMKTILTCLVAAATVGATATTVEPRQLPPCQFPDTEVSTNCQFSTARTGGLVLSLHLSLLASPSNNVEIAIGHDSDGDGHLSACEAGATVGWDCGEWVARCGMEELHADAATPSVRKQLTWRLFVSDGTVRKLEASENGHSLDFGLNGPPPAWLFSPTWDVVRFIARGADAADESLRAELHANGTVIKLR